MRRILSALFYIFLSSYASAEGEIEEFTFLAVLAEQGDIDSQITLGNLYFFNIEYRQLEKAKYWYEKAAKKGNSHAQNELGNVYSHSQYAHRDFSKAKYWYQKSADQGNSSAQVTLGSSYLPNWDHLGSDHYPDYAKAKYWLEKSVKQNNTTAQNILGTMYEHGRGVRQSKATAKELYGKACDNGDQIGCNNYKALNSQ
ncbi:MAG: tetratricopeptide repeat protein [Pseudomonas sp.]|nr:tetratricopeptide repeat protein [Pseudomonas sp.]